MFGEDGDDAMLGDRGGIVNQLIDTGQPAQTVSMNAPPAETFVGFRPGTLDRRVDLLHDVDGDTSGRAARRVSPRRCRPDGMPTAGRTDPRRARARLAARQGGDDLVNGDSGGDLVFGDDGDDVLWGGRGCDPVRRHRGRLADC